MANKSSGQRAAEMQVVRAAAGYVKHMFSADAQVWKQKMFDALRKLEETYGEVKLEEAINRE